jgi:hypothetical protein
MNRHTCKHCNNVFKYCRSCLITPIPYKDAGYCSIECYKASKIEEVVPVADVEIVINDEDISTSEEETVEHPHSFYEFVEEEENEEDGYEQDYSQEL